MEERLFHLGIYGVLQQDKQILAIKKRRGVYTGLWDLPGGTPEFFETFEETLEREFLEETGLHVENYTFLTNLLSVKSFGNTILRHVGLIYLINSYSGTLKRDTDDKDSDGGSFIALDTNSNMCTPFMKAVTNETITIASSMISTI